ncbi:MAG: signal peptidase I, partial [Pseudomonadota bacterium]
MTSSEKTTASDVDSDASPSMSAMEEAWDIAKTVLIAVSITLFIRFFFFQPFNIPSGSMKPTLLVGDFILVDKMEYGYSKASLIYPLTRMPLEGRLFDGEPQRGEVVVFKNTGDRNRDYIKRVTGVAGDRIQ